MESVTNKEAKKIAEEFVKNAEEFMIQSNAIEGEKGLNPGDFEAIEYACHLRINGEDDLKNLHNILGKYLNKGWVGEYRKIDVTVGKYSPPHHMDVPDLMTKYFSEFDRMDSWEAHNKFEEIHPFQDLNGRMGRLIWLSKALDEGYTFKLSFLHAYYYQTLNKWRDVN